MPDVPNLGSSAARAREELLRQKPPESIKAVTAFLLFITPEGQVGSTPDLSRNIEVERAPSSEEVSYACLQVHDELKAQKQAVMTAQQVIGASMQAASRGREMAEAQRLEEELRKQNHGG